MPFLLRATPRQDLAGWSLRSEANLTAAGHSRDTPGPVPRRYGTPPRRCLTSSIRAIGAGRLRWLCRSHVADDVRAVDGHVVAVGIAEDEGRMDSSALDR